MPVFSVSPRCSPLLRWEWPSPPSSSDCSDRAARIAASGFGGCVICASAMTLLDAGDDISDCITTLARYELECWLAIMGPPSASHVSPPRRKLLRCHEWTTEKGRWRKRKFARPAAYAAAFVIRDDSNPVDLAASLEITDAINQFVQPRGLSPRERYRVFAFTEDEAPDCDPCEQSAWVSWRAILEPIAAAAGSGNSVRFRGFWLEPPTLMCGDANVLPWPGDLAREFTSRYGELMLPILPALIAEVGPTTARERQRFWQLLVDLADRNLHRPLHEWARSRNLRVVYRAQPSSLAALATQPRRGDVAIAIPDAVDRLRVRTLASLSAESSDQPGEVFAFLTEPIRERPVCERKALLEQCLLSGATRIVLADERDLTPPFPCDEAREALLRHVRSVHAVLHAGRRGARVALLLPQSSARAHHDQADPLSHCLEEDFAYVAGKLEELKVDFAVIDEDHFRGSRLEDAILRVGDAAFELLVLPSITTLSRELWNKLESFRKCGGRIAALGLLPRESEHGHDETLTAIAMRTSCVDLDAVYDTYQQAVGNDGVFIDSFPVFREDPSGGRFCSYQPRLCHDQADATNHIRQILRESHTADVQTLTDPIIYARRHLSDEDSVFFVLNNSPSPARATLRLRGSGEVMEIAFNASMDTTQQLATRQRPVYAVLDDEVIAVPVEFASGESLALLIAPPPRPHVETTNVVVESLAEAPDTFAVRGYATSTGDAFVEIACQLESSTASDDSQWLQILGEGPRFVQKRYHASVEIANVPEFIDLRIAAATTSARTRLPGLLQRHRRRRESDHIEGPITLNATFELHEVTDRSVFLELAGATDGVEVKLNENVIGLRLFPPFRFDLSGGVRNGENKLELRTSHRTGAAIEARIAIFPVVTLQVRKR